MKIYMFIGLFAFAFGEFWDSMMDDDYFVNGRNPYEFPNVFPYIFARSSGVDESDATSAELTETENRMENENLFEGDIIIRNPFEVVNGLPIDSMRWEDGVIPYVIDEALNNQRSCIQSAMQHISSLTCIRFVERTNEHNYVLIHRGNGCKSEWGRKGGAQLLSLGDAGCYFFGTVVHELMHTIGFLHEHSRSDRDDYITIYWENIIPGEKFNFKKLSPSENRLFTQFDTKSIMLYGSRTFSLPNTYSMKLKDGSILDEVASKESLSNLDATKIKSLYQCK